MVEDNPDMLDNMIATLKNSTDFNLAATFKSVNDASGQSSIFRPNLFLINVDSVDALNNIPVFVDIFPDAKILGLVSNWDADIAMNVIAAGALGCIVKPFTAQDILENFGSDIALLVEHETENKRPDMPPSQSWKIRKEESLEVLRTAGTKTKILWVADKLSNMRALAADYEIKGAAAFDKFNVTDPAEQKWYHRTVLDYTSELKNFPAYREYERLFRFVFENV